MIEPLDLTLLRSFVTIVDCGSIRLAAGRLGRSQSAVSMQIKRLEDMIGRRLFHREGRTLRLNSAGDELLLHARRLLRLSDEALTHLQSPEAAGMIRFGVPEDYAAFLLAPLLARFAQDHPLTKIALTFDTSSGLIPLLEDGQLDLALVTREPHQPLTILRREALVWAAAPEHEAWTHDPLPLALSEAGDISRRLALEALQGAERLYRVVSSSKSLLGQIAVARAGLAVVALLGICLPPDLVRLGEAEGLPTLPILELGLAYAPGEPSRPTARFIDFLSRELGSGT